MPKYAKIPDEDVHNSPGVVSIPDEDVHNHPTSIDTNNVPEFERQAAGGVQLTQGNEQGSIAHVDPDQPNTIAVDSPSRFTPDVQAHELTHTIQNKAGGGNEVDTNPENFKSQSDIDKVYGYSGTDGLAKIMSSTKGISVLNKEQQASIPQTYMKEYAKAKESKDPKAIDRLNAVYEPAIRQLRNMANTSKDKINTTPDAPAAPPAELTGEAVPVKGMYNKNTSSGSVAKTPKWDYNTGSRMHGGK